MRLNIVLLGVTIGLGLFYVVGVNADEPVARVTSKVSMPLVINGSLVGDLPSWGEAGERRLYRIGTPVHR